MEFSSEKNEYRLRINEVSSFEKLGEHTKQLSNVPQLLTGWLKIILSQKKYKPATYWLTYMAM